MLVDGEFIMNWLIVSQMHVHIVIRCLAAFESFVNFYLGLI